MKLPPIESVRPRIITMRVATGQDLLGDPAKLMRVDDPTSSFYGQVFVVEDVPPARENS